MLALAATVFVASVLGSMHCAGMCGAFVAFSVYRPEDSALQHLSLQAAYHGGRLATYALLGAVAGALGAALDLGGAWLGVQRLALMLAGAAMVAFGAAILLRAAGVRVPSVATPQPLRRLVLRGHQTAQRWPPRSRALAVGLLSTLLPCGWLHAFAITAAGTGSASRGALTMLVFWAGTVPMLAVIGVGVRKLAGPLGRYVPLLSSMALIAVGLAALAGRLDVRVPATVTQAPTTDQAIERVRGLNPDEMPCCFGAPGADDRSR